MADLHAVLLAMMLVVRRFKGAFENAPCEISCSNKAPTRSIGFAVSTGRSTVMFR